MKKRLTYLALVLIITVSLFSPASAANADVHTTVVDGGMSHSLALMSDQTVYAWGSNSYGQLGLGRDIARQDTPKAIPDLSSVTAVAAGNNFSMALRSDGQVLVWGGGVYDSPTVVKGLNNVVAISGGQTDCLALTTAGYVYQWSLGGKPARIKTISKIVSIDAGSGGHFLALSRNGQVWAWGANFAGQLGDGTTKDCTTPVKVSGLQDIVDIAAGMDHSLAVSYNGTVYAWGKNDKGQLGHTDSDGVNNLTPTAVSKITKAVQVSAGYGTSLAQTESGAVYAWGYGEYGQLGYGRNELFKSEPRQISDDYGVATSIACGLYHNLCVNSSGVLFVWGRNDAGQLGTGKSVNYNSPSRITRGLLSSTSYDTCIMSDASSWALEGLGQLYPSGVIPPLLLGNYQSAITRGELAHLLVSVYEACRKTVAVPNKNPFKDIESHALKDSILKAYSLKIVSGTSATTFKPNGKVTRQEAAGMICGFIAKMKDVTIPSTAKTLSYYSDANQIASWAAPYVEYAYNNNIMRGSGGAFKPMEVFTREQSLVAVLQLIKEYRWMTL